MAQTDPLMLEIGSDGYTLPRVHTQGSTSKYAVDTSTLQLELVLNCFAGRRQRQTARLNITKIAADPLTSANAWQSMSVYTVMDSPKLGLGFSDTYIEQARVGLSDLLSTGVAAKLLGGQT